MARREPLTTKERLARLERHSHKPFDFSDLISRLEYLEARVRVLTADLEKRFARRRTGSVSKRKR